MFVRDLNADLLGDRKRNLQISVDNNFIQKGTDTEYLVVKIILYSIPVEIMIVHLI